MEKEITIYKDIYGNYDIDQYYKEEDLEDLKEFLKKRGVNTIFIEEDEDSIEKQRSFQTNKPRVMRKDTKKINWLKKEVLIELLCSKEQDDFKKTKTLCSLSGFDFETLPDNKKPSGFISPNYSDFHKKYDKWKREHELEETLSNKKMLVGKWADVYISYKIKKKNKKVELGSVVYVTSEKLNMIVEEYDEKLKKFLLIDKKGLIMYCKRNEFEVMKNEN
jgi:hypothetical protein